HRFGVARPFVELRLGLVPSPWRELFHIPNFRQPRADPARLQAVGPAHIRAIVGVRHELKAPAALGHGDHHRHRPRTPASAIMTDEAVTHLATAALLPLATDVFGAPFAHAWEIGDEIVDGFRGRMDFDTGFSMHAMDSHARAPR